jgi:hypothetical protein
MRPAVGLVGELDVMKRVLGSWEEIKHSIGKKLNFRVSC